MKIRLNNGAEYDALMCIPSAQSLALNVAGEYGMAEIAAAFDDPANTARITCIDGDAETVHAGYTFLTTVNRYIWDPAKIQIVLNRETE